MSATILDQIATSIRGLTEAIAEMGDTPLTLPSHLKALTAELAELNDRNRVDRPIFQDSTGAVVYRSGRRFVPNVSNGDLAWREVTPLPGGKKGGRNPPQPNGGHR